MTGNLIGGHIRQMDYSHITGWPYRLGFGLNRKDGSGAMRRLLAILALLVVSFSALAQNAIQPYVEYRKRVEAAQNISPLDTSLFGEQVSLYNGSTTFSATDIDVPGNSTLPVRLSRRLAVELQPGSSATGGYDSLLRGVGNWDVDVPYMAATYALSSSNTLRCDGSYVPGDGIFRRGEVWQGISISIPGRGNISALGMQATTTPRPSGGATYKLTTSERDVFDCIPMQSGFSGQGFRMTTVSGQRYYFDVAVLRTAARLVKYRKDNSGLPIPIYLDRNKFYLLASKIEDRFGNTVQFQYNANGHPTRIWSNDGREILLTYTNGQLSSATSHGRTWQYQYVDIEGGLQGLAVVVQPDNSRWQYAYSGTLMPSSDPNDLPPMPWCGGYPLMLDATFTLTATHPSGATGTFNFSNQRHYRSGVHATECMQTGDPADPDYDLLVPHYFDVMSIDKKSIGGPGLPVLTWNYTYAPHMQALWGTHTSPPTYPCTTCDASKMVTVTNPDNTKSRYTFGIRYYDNDGRQLMVETLRADDTVIRTETNTYLTEAQVASQPFYGEYGSNLGGIADPASTRIRPVTSHVIIQDGVTFSSYVNSYDAYARPVSVGKWSSLGYGKTDVTEYYDDTTHWVLGQVKRHYNADTNLVDVRNEYDPNTALVLQTYAFEKLKATMTYNADGTLATSKDGNNNTTTFSNWKRGVPQAIQYADGTSVSAIVNDNGWVTAVTDENGFSTGYGYDVMGRLASIVYPNESTFNYNTKTVEFRALTSSDWMPPGVQAGQWRRYEVVGNHATITYYDSLWRPILVHNYDASNVGPTLQSTRFEYDTNGRKTFASYPNSALIPDGAGVHTSYDALSRVTQTQQDSELGTLTTTTEYLTGFQVRTTNPRGYQTTNGYQVYDQPSYDQLAWSAQPENKDVIITRNFFGMPLTIKQADHANAAVSVTRSYAYDGYMQLCKTLEPETGATLMDYDAAGNLAWNASGLRGGDYDNASECPNSRSAAYGSGRRVGRNYDARNRITGLWFPDGKGSQSWTYTPDGLVATSIVDNDGPSAGSVDQAYTYNRRRLLAGESMSQRGWYGWSIGYGYDANANVAANTYPDTFNVNFTNNALGQPTQVTGNGTVLASGVSYYPNGGISQFTYGNGIVHTMTQNARQLPARSTDSGSTVDFVYTYDQNGNTTKINDWAQDGVNSGDALHIRYLYYDGLDRLTDAGSCSFGGDCWHRFHYNALDNITSWTLGGGVKDYANYIYDGNNRLTQINNTAGAVIVTLGYDAQGNLASKGGQSYAFDYGNRLKSVPGVAGYRYDAQGRRVLDWAPAGNILPMYSMGGQLLFDENHRVAGTRASDYVYLSGSLLATYERNYSTGVSEFKYQHTDALGSPVAVTNQSAQVIERTSYEPYGNVIGRTNNDKPGYTGHVMDSATGLTYMQQRYYDPTIGRFLSTDPVTAYEKPGQNFNRYVYASNNPYKFIDPDGRQSITIKSPNKELTPEEHRLVATTLKMVFLTVRGVRAGGTPAQKQDLSKWKITIDTQAKSAPITGGVMETGLTKEGKIETTVSQKLESLKKPGEIMLTGTKVQGGNSALEFAGLHEYAGHGNFDNKNIDDPMEKEHDANETARKIMSKDASVKSQPQECKPCYLVP